MLITSFFNPTPCLQHGRDLGLGVFIPRQRAILVYKVCTQSKLASQPTRFFDPGHIPLVQMLHLILLLLHVVGCSTPCGPSPGQCRHVPLFFSTCAKRTAVHLQEMARPTGATTRSFSQERAPHNRLSQTSLTRRVQVHFARVLNLVKILNPG